MNLSMQPPAPLKVLVVDDVASVRPFLGALIRKEGYQVFEARDGVDAVEVFVAENPDIVLMDLEMPRLDGPGAMLRMRELAGERWVPVIFITANGDADSLARVLKLGALDYLVKPVGAALVGAKLEVAKRMIEVHREYKAQNLALTEYRAKNESELRIAKHLMKRIVQQDKLSDPMLEHWILPATHFSGDLVLAARTPCGTLHVMLADGAGHGLSAAINVLPITPAFYAMTQKGLGIDLIAETMNRTIRNRLPIDRFVAATLIAVDYATCSVKIWNGGNPPAIALNFGGEVIARFKSKNLGLGLCPPDAWSPSIDEFSCPDPFQMFAYSDGAVESHDAVDGVPGEKVFEEIVLGAPTNVRMKLLRARLAARNIEKHQHDDQTLVLVKCPGSAGKTVEPVAADSAKPAEVVPAWQFQIAMTPTELRNPYIIQSLTSVLSMIPRVKPRAHELGVVLTELFTNALDHGVLGLKSAVKDGPEPFAEYSAARAAALQNLDDGSVVVRLETDNHAGRPQLKIVVRDSGSGFSYAEYCEAQAAPRLRPNPYGRGIMIVRSLCTQVEYNDRGNEASVWYPLDTAAVSNRNYA